MEWEDVLFLERAIAGKHWRGTEPIRDQVIRSTRFILNCTVLLYYCTWYDSKIASVIELYDACLALLYKVAIRRCHTTGQNKPEGHARKCGQSALTLII